MEQLQASLDASVREVQDHERDKQSLAQRVSLLQAAHESASSQCGYGTAPGLETGTPRGPSSTSEERQQREREEEEERKREENLQEQLAVAQREATRLSELLSQVQEDTQAAHSQVSTLTCLSAEVVLSRWTRSGGVLKLINLLRLVFCWVGC